MIEGKQSVISRARRDFLKGRVGQRTYHIASLLVQAHPDRMAEVRDALVRIPGVEDHGLASPAKLIVTLEVGDDDALVEAVGRVEATAGVITASLVYHQMDDGQSNEGAA